MCNAMPLLSEVIGVALSLQPVTAVFCPAYKQAYKLNPNLVYQESIHPRYITEKFLGGQLHLFPIYSMRNQTLPLDFKVKYIPLKGT